MKILQIGNVALDPFLGSGKKRLGWSSGLRERGHSVDIYEPKNYELWHGKINKGKKFRQALGAYLFLRKINLKNYDLIEFTGDEFWLAQKIIKKRKSRPLLVASTDGLELLASERAAYYNKVDGIGKYFRKKFNEWTHGRFSKIAFSNADYFLSIAALDREYVVQNGFFHREKTEVVLACIDIDFFIPFGEVKENRVAFTGSWIDRKGVSLVAQVVGEALEKDPTLQFDVYGTSGKRDLVLSSFPDKLRSQIHIYPKISNQELAENLARAKVFFFPTQYEGFGIATAEAMACGCAVITTPTGLGWELKDGDEAVVCDFNDYKKMSEELSALLTDEMKRVKIARGGWEFVQKLKWENSIRILEETYARWVKEWQTQAR